MNVYDKVTVSGINGEADKFGQIVQIRTETTVRPNEDFSGIDTETVTKVTVLTIPDMKAITVDFGRITINAVKLAETPEMIEKPSSTRTTRK